MSRIHSVPAAPDTEAHPGGVHLQPGLLPLGILTLRYGMLSLSLTFCVSLSLSLCLSSLSIYITLSIYISLSICLFICLSSITLFPCLSLFLSLSLSLSLYLSLYISIYLFFQIPTKSMGISRFFSSFEKIMPKQRSR